MKRKLLKLSMAVGAVLFTGCAIGQGQPQVHSLNTPQKKIVFNLNFPKKDPLTGEKVNVKLDTLKQEIAKDFPKYTKYGVIKIYGWRKINPTRGVRVTINDREHFYKVEYVNGVTHSHGTEFLTEYIFKVPYNIDKKQITLLYPTKYTFIPCNNAIGEKLKPLDTPENIKKDMLNALNKLRHNNLYIKKRYELKGKIKTAYTKQSVYEKYKEAFGLENDYLPDSNVFNFPFKGENGKLTIKCYPYSGGTEIDYKVTIPYKLYSNNTSSLTKTELEKIKQKIASVVKD